jgi:DNA repair exonuclease SbcCD nuclease subunit
LDAAARRGLDYLALGHWHSFYQHDARTVYPGTPEPTGFDEPGSGTVSVVRIEGPGATPVVEQVRVSGLNWMQREETLIEPVEVGLQALKKRIEEHAQPDQTLLRLLVRGQATVEAEAALEDLEAWAKARVLYLDLDRTGVAPDISRGRLRDLAAAHPLLAGMIADLAALELMADSPGSIQPGHHQEQDQIQRVQAEPLELDELRKAVAATATNADTIREAIKLLGGFASKVWL